MPVCFVNAFAALLIAKVSAGPELPISAVSVVALLFVGEPMAAPTATASALIVTTPNMSATSSEDLAYQEIDFVATPERLVTVRKSSTADVAYDVAGLHSASETDPVGILVQRLVDDVADTYLDLLDSIYFEIDTLEDQIDTMDAPMLRHRSPK